MAGTAGDPAFGGGAYWSCTTGVDGQYGIELSVSAGGAVLGAGWTAVATGYSVRCVRAREGQAIPCFFPLAGWAGEPSAVTGNYWTAQIPQYDPGQGYLLTLDGHAAGASAFTPRASAVSGRCVRAREGQAVPLFWIVGFLGSLNYEGLAGVRGIRSGCLGVCQACSVTHRKRYGFR